VKVVLDLKAGDLHLVGVVRDQGWLGTHDENTVGALRRPPKAPPVADRASTGRRRHQEGAPADVSAPLG